MYQRILVPIDGSPTAEQGLTEAIRLGTLTHARLRLIHIVDELSFALAIDAYGVYAGELLELLQKNGAEVLENGAARVRTAGLDVETTLYANLDRTVPQCILEEARDWRADLIVLGTHGRRGVRRLMLGSSAENVLRSAPVPVLLVRGVEEKAADGAPAAPSH